MNEETGDMSNDFHTVAEWYTFYTMMSKSLRLYTVHHIFVPLKETT